VGGLPEIVAHGISGYVVDSQPLVIAAALQDFFENERATQFRAGVRAEKKRFSWDYLVARLLE
jgi:glycosyltransferase involved in cell wall biosynthesis